MEARLLIEADFEYAFVGIALILFKKRKPPFKPNRESKIRIFIRFKDSVVLC